MSSTRDKSSRPWHCQYSHTSPGAGTREVNLLEGEFAGPEVGFPDTMAVGVNRPVKLKQAM